MVRMPRVLSAACVLGLAGARGAQVGSLDDTSALVQSPPAVPKLVAPAGPDMKFFEHLADNEMWKKLQQGHPENHTALPANLARGAAAAVKELDGNFSNWQQQQPRSLEDVIKLVQKAADPKGGLKADALKGLIQQWQAKQAEDFGRKAKAWLEGLAAKAPAPFAPKEMQASWQTQLMHMAESQLKALGAKAQEDLKTKVWPLQQPNILNGLMEAIKKFTKTDWKPFVTAVQTAIANQAKRKQAAKSPMVPKAFASPAARAPPKVDFKALLEAAVKSNKYIADAVNGMKAKTQQVMPSDINWFHRIDTNGWKSGAIVQKTVPQGNFYFGGHVKGGAQKAATSVFGGAFGKDGSAATTSVGSVFRPGKLPFVVASHFANPQRKPSAGVPPASAALQAVVAGEQAKAAAAAAFAGAVQMSFARQYEKMISDHIKKGAKFVYLLGLKKARLQRRAKHLWMAAHPRARRFLAIKKMQVIQAFKKGRAMWWQARQAALKKALIEAPKVQAALAGAKAAWLAESQRQAKAAEAAKAAGAKTPADKKLEAFTEYINHPEHVWKEVQRQLGEKLFYDVTHAPKRMEAKPQPPLPKLEDIQKFLKDPKKALEVAQKKVGEDLLKSYMSKAAAKPSAQKPAFPFMPAQGVHLEQSRPAKLAPRVARKVEEEKPVEEAEATEEPKDVFGGLFGSDAPFWATVAGALSAAAETAQHAL